METQTCKSCERQFTGNYCNHCGEKVINQEDRKLKYYLGEFINALTFADNKLWRSLKRLLINPGKLSKDFVEGRRRAYMKPVSIFFLANLVYFLFPFINTFTTNLEIQTVAFSYSELADQWVNEKVEERNISYEEYADSYDAKTAELSKLFIVAMASILSMFFWPIHIGSKHNLIADHMSAGLEVMSFVLIYCLELIAIVLLLIKFLGANLFSDFVITSISLLMLTYFFARMEYTFYGFRGIRLIVNTVLCLVSVVLTLEIYRGLLFFITFWSI